MIIHDDMNLVDQKFIGVPFQYEGRTLAATDCIGLTILYLREHGFTYEYDVAYEPALKHWYESSMQKFRDAMMKYGKIVLFSELRKFDLVMFFGANVSDKFPTVLGIIVDEGRHFLMNFPDSGSHVVMLDEAWKSRFFGGMRLWKVIEKEGA